MKPVKTSDDTSKPDVNKTRFFSPMKITHWCIINKLLAASNGKITSFSHYYSPSINFVFWVKSNKSSVAENCVCWTNLPFSIWVCWPKLSFSKKKAIPIYVLWQVIFQFNKFFENCEFQKKAVIWNLKSTT